MDEVTLRSLGEQIGVDHPQQIKHHLAQLERKGLVSFDARLKQLKRMPSRPSPKASSPIVSIPIIGVANCGQPTLFADQYLEGVLRISRRIINRTEDVFAIRASGLSMNRANINGLSIDDGDYVVVDHRPFTPQNGDYVLVVIDDVGAIKKFTQEKESGDIVLVSESTEEHAPIHIRPEDQQFIISGRVIYVVKKPKPTTS